MTRSQRSQPAAHRHESAAGPLRRYRILELAGEGPGPYAAMLLADLGADVVRVDRPQSPTEGQPPDSRKNVLNRSRRSITLDLRDPGDVERFLTLVSRADALIEPFRPGVAERLGIGPDTCMARNERLVYGRMTGWGQSGPYAHHAGHDINYIALAGALAHIGRSGNPPVPPLNLVGDMAGGGLLLAFGLVSALLETASSGMGQVVDAAMVDGAASLMMWAFSMRAQGFMRPERGTNVFDTGAHFYEVYECADGRFVCVGTIESRFYRNLLDALGLSDRELPWRGSVEHWPEMKQLFADTFRTKTREQWCEILEQLPDICFAPVLDMDEAPVHPHNQARQTYTTLDGIVQPAVAPRFSRTPGAIQRRPSMPGEHTAEVLGEWLADGEAPR